MIHPDSKLLMQAQGGAQCSAFNRQIRQMPEGCSPALGEWNRGFLGVLLQLMHTQVCAFTVHRVRAL